MSLSPSQPPLDRTDAPRVLVVDDSPEVRRAVRRSLRSMGMVVELLSSGEEALSRMREAPPDLVLTDVNMPGMDGFEVLSAIRGDARTATLPVVLMTARDDRPSMRRGMSLGADDYLTKPFTAGEIRETVRARLEHQARVSAVFAARLQRTQAALFAATHSDAETGLPNRTALREALSAAEDGPSPLSILVIEIDRFERLSSALAPRRPERVEQLVRTVAERIQRVAGDGGQVYRLGPSGFAVLHPGPGAAEAAQQLAERVLAEIRQPIDGGGIELRITASAGVAVWEVGGAEGPTACAGHAEVATYNARENGGNHAAVYDGAIHARAYDRLALESSMHRAIERDQFELHYQPQVAAGTGELIGVEALIRWRHPELGMVSPFHFIPIAEETGLIVPIGEWVMRTACAQVARWSEELPGLRVAINLSALQLAQRDLVQTVLSTLETTGLPAAQLKVELTETMMVQAGPDAAARLRSLREAGVSVSIDDFGTGYSSLANLRSFPVGEVKIDRSFVRHVPDDRDNSSIVAAVIEMAHQLGLRVIAEGAEESTQVQFLREHGCDGIQGYYFSKPLPPDEVLPWARVQAHAA